MNISINTFKDYIYYLNIAEQTNDQELYQICEEWYNDPDNPYGYMFDMEE